MKVTIKVQKSDLKGTITTTFKKTFVNQSAPLMTFFDHQSLFTGSLV